MLVVLSTMGSVHADINETMWLQPTFQGSDSFYDATVTAYTEGSTAMLAVTVDRDSAPASPINITAISVIFDWGGNYTMALATPFVLDDTITQASFTVTFTVPPTTEASNLFLHTYRVNVKYVTDSGPSMFTTVPPDFFAVYSTGQADAQTQGQTAKGYNKPAGLFDGGFESPQANILWEKGRAELGKGDAAYNQGNFVAAKTYYQNAVTLFEQAYTTETSQDPRAPQANATTTQADASMITANAATTQAEAALRQADATLTNAYGWLAFGIGWILVGIGAIIYGLRRPKAPA